MKYSTKRKKHQHQKLNMINGDNKMYKTIGRKVKEQFQDVTGMNCFCDTQISKKNLAYYVNEFGELKTICNKCALTIFYYELSYFQEYIKIIFSEKTRTFNIKEVKEIKKWLEILNSIPVGKAWKLIEDNKGYKLSSVKAGVKIVNKEAKKQLFRIIEKRINNKKVLFVIRLRR